MYLYILDGHLTRSVPNRFSHYANPGSASHTLASFSVVPCPACISVHEQTVSIPSPSPTHLPFHLPLLSSFSLLLFFKYVHAPPVFPSLCFLSYVSPSPSPVPLDALATSSTRTCPFQNRRNRHFQSFFFRFFSDSIFVPSVGKSIDRGSSSSSLFSRISGRDGGGDTSRHATLLTENRFYFKKRKILLADSFGQFVGRTGIERKVGPRFFVASSPDNRVNGSRGGTG